MISGIFLLISGPELRGQGLTWMGIDFWEAVEAASLRLGPLRIDGTISLANVGYDTNIYPGSLGDPIEDVVGTARTDLTLYLPLSNKVVFAVVESPYYLF